MRLTLKLCQWPHIKPRVVVTGLGVVSCLGVGVKQMWPRLLNGETGITALTQPGKIGICSSLLTEITSFSKYDHFMNHILIHGSKLQLHSSC